MDVITAAFTLLEDLKERPDITDPHISHSLTFTTHDETITLTCLTCAKTIFTTTATNDTADDLDPCPIAIDPYPFKENEDEPPTP